MSGDSPNAFTNENVFDFKEGRSSPAPTTSKDPNPGVVQASVLVEPQKDKKDKDKEDEDSPDFSTPILNPGADDKKGGKSDPDRTLELNDPKYEGPGKGGKKEEENLLNGGLDRLPNPYAKKESGQEDGEDDSCIVNCIYYTMECCKCSIV